MKKVLGITLPLGAAAILAASFSLAKQAQDQGEEQEEPFDEARLLFEHNDTDGDLGIHALIDGDEWKRLQIDDPHDVVDARCLRARTLAAGKG